MIYNITTETFGPLGIRNGDLIAIVNIVHHLRKKENNPSIRFYFEPGALNADDYIHKFYTFLTTVTDCFSDKPGEKTLPWKNVGVWDYRDISGDHAVIKNPRRTEKKVVVFPLYDAQYNVQRNWSMECLYGVLKEANELYPDHEKIICARDIPPSAIDLHGFTLSIDFMTNIEHIMTADVFYGGDTGVSHFASVLEPGPQVLNYMYGSHCMIHTIPFYCISKHRGNLRTFWLDFTGTKWE